MTTEQRTPSILAKRLMAFGIDYLIILAYISGLAGLTLALFAISGDDPTAVHPLRGQLVGMVTLTLPVFLYFFLMERGGRKATLGKRAMGIRVESTSGSRGVFLRNFFKLLPWEIAHTGVHWMFFYAAETGESPAWVYMVLSVPQFIMLVYFLSLIFSRGKAALYDRWAGTCVALV